MNKYYFSIVISVLFLDIEAQVPRSLNVIVYCDLSERIARDGQIDSDLVLLNDIVNVFGEVVKSRYIGGRLRSEDRLSINFNPPVASSAIATNLELDFSRFSVSQKLGYFLECFPKNDPPPISKYVDSLYSSAKSQHPLYPGSDLFTFVKDDLPKLVIGGFDNRLIVITDGYLYMDKSNPLRSGNRIGHLEGSILDPLRKSSNWLDTYENDKWGIASAGVSFPSLQVLMMELIPDCINNSHRPRTHIVPLRPCLNEYDILQRFWSDWFIEMDAEDVEFVKHKKNTNPSHSALVSFLNG